MGFHTTRAFVIRQMPCLYMKTKLAMNVCSCKRDLAEKSFVVVRT